jgi:hypothetical protein
MRLVLLKAGLMQADFDLEYWNGNDYHRARTKKVGEMINEEIVSGAQLEVHGRLLSKAWTENCQRLGEDPLHWSQRAVKLAEAIGTGQDSGVVNRQELQRYCRELNKTLGILLKER